MSISEFQQCLFCIYLDRSFRDLFFIEPELCFQKYCLTDDEKDKLRQLDYKQIKRFSSGLVGKAQDAVFSRFPLSLAVNSDAMKIAFNRFYELFSKIEFMDYSDQADAFVVFAKDYFNAHQGAENYLSDLICFERLAKKNMVLKIQENNVSTVITEVCSVKLNEGVVIESFNYDVYTYSHLIKQNDFHFFDNEMDLPKEKFYYLFKPKSQNIKAKIFLISKEFFDFLAQKTLYKPLASIYHQANDMIQLLINQHVLIPEVV